MTGWNAQLASVTVRLMGVDNGGEEFRRRLAEEGRLRREQQLREGILDVYSADSRERAEEVARYYHRWLSSQGHRVWIDERGDGVGTAALYVMTDLRCSLDEWDRLSAEHREGERLAREAVRAERENHERATNLERDRSDRRSRLRDRFVVAALWMAVGLAAVGALLLLRLDYALGTAVTAVLPLAGVVFLVWMVAEVVRGR